MSIAFAEVETAPASAVHVPRSPQTRAATLHCLVVSECPQRRELFARSAEDAGWQPTLCPDAGSASLATARFQHQLAIVDLESASRSSASELRAFVETLSGALVPLTMICAAEGNGLEEIWARQLGAWLYLPGVDASCDVSMLCHEAQQVVEKLWPEWGRPGGQPAVYARTA